MKLAAASCVLALSVLITNCGEKVTSPGLDPEQAKTLQNFSSPIESGLLAIEGNELFEKGDAKLSKAASDSLADCSFKTTYDSHNRANGRIIGGVYCPIRGEWSELAIDDTTVVISITYSLMDSLFGVQVPVQSFTIKGTRVKNVTTYSGTSYDLELDQALFRAKRTADTYNFMVTYKGSTFSGRSENGSTYVNDTKISGDEFQTLFFVLK